METNLTGIREVSGSTPGLTQWGYRSGVAMSCGVGGRCSLDLILLWLWRRPVATALIQPLAWAPPYAAGVTLKSQKRKKERKNLFKAKSMFTYFTRIHIIKEYTNNLFYISAFWLEYTKIHSQKNGDNTAKSQLPPPPPP